MYKIAVEIKDSRIDKKGVFASADIKKGELVWIFTKGHDTTLSPSEYKALPEKEKAINIGYLSPWTGRWVFPPEGDAARHTNHSSDNNLSVVFDKNVSTEPYFVANRVISKGEELTNNYLEFDQISQKTKPNWIK